MFDTIFEHRLVLAVIIGMLAAGGYYLTVDWAAPGTAPGTGDAPEACKTTGCSGTLCVPADADPIATTCEWRAAYGCYTGCEVRDGSCGFDAAAYDQCTSCIAECRESDGGQDCIESCYPEQ